MDQERFAEFTSRLLGAVSRDPNVIGLIALGSMAERAFRDQYSDHDFWIVTRPGREEFYLGSTDWLPDAHRILITARQGDHYRTAIYWDGHKVEYGVFEPGTAIQGKVERYNILLERGGMVDLAKTVREAARRERQEHDVRPQNLLNFTIIAWTYHQRIERGEWIAAHRCLTAAVEILLDLMSGHVWPEDDKAADFLDPTRRLEKRFPDLAGELKSILTTVDLTSGPALLRIAERELRPQAPDLEWNELATVREWMEDSLEG